MHKLLLLLLSSFIFKSSFEQLTTIPGKPRLMTKKENEMDEKNKNCFYNKKYSIQQRLQFYPFNKATAIQLVSFNQPDSIIMGGELPIKNGSVDYAQLKEVITITKAQTDALTDLLYNRGYGGKFYSLTKTKCYTPRNAILFLDASGKTFAFIEICFECEGHRLSSNKIKAGDFCNQKYTYLQKFFETNNVLFGITREN